MYSSATTDAGGFGFALGAASGVGVGVACSEAQAHGLVATAARARWSAERTLALPGRCRGTVLARWADNARRHFGSTAVARIREELPPWAQDLPDDPPEEAWFPVGLQLRITEIVIDALLGGDALALEPLLRQDVRAGVSRATALFLRTVGPAPVLGRAKQIHPSLYDVGQVRAELVGSHATLRFGDALLFGHPTWALLQLFAHRGFVALTGRRVTQLGITVVGEDAARIELGWG